jgi:hypothetical protein
MSAVNDTSVASDSLDPETALQLSFSSISCIVVAAFAGVYLTDYFIHGKKQVYKLVKNSAKHENLGTSQYVKRLHFKNQRLDDIWSSFVSFFMKATLKGLHKLTLWNFALIFVYMLCYAITFNPDVSFDGLVWLYALNIVLYGVAKFVLAGFYIVRYQITSLEMDKADSNMVLGLWFLNLTSLVCLVASTFSNPPYLTMITTTAGMIFTILFVTFDSLLHMVLLYLFISPLRSHVSESTEQFRRSSSKTRSRTRSGEIQWERIRILQSIVARSTFGCFVSISLTILDNLSYILAYYVFTGPEYSVIGDSFWMNIYSIIIALEAMACSFLPLYNYIRFHEMWLCRATADETQIPSANSSGRKRPTPRLSVEIQDNANAGSAAAPMVFQSPHSPRSVAKTPLED